MAKKTESPEQPEVLRANPEQFTETESPEQPEVLRPTLLEDAVSPELSISNDLVTVENELGVQHKVSSTAAKALLKDKNIKIIANG